MEYYHVTSAVEDGAYASKAWSEQFRRSFPCLHRPSEEPLDVVLSNLGEEGPLTFVRAGGPDIARSDLLEAFMPEAEHYLLFGRVFDETGKQLELFKTLGTSKSFQLRGGPKSTRQFCPRCGQFLYYPMGRWYLLQSQLTGQPLYYSEGLMGLVVNQELYERLANKNLGKLHINPLPILDAPLDGLPPNLDNMDAETLERFGGAVRVGEKRATTGPG